MADRIQKPKISTFFEKRRISGFAVILNMRTVLTIAGFDPSSGAGVTADLLVFAAHGLVGTAAITALTVQSATAVRGVHPIDSGVLAEMLTCLHAEHSPSGIKIGMLANAANVGVVCDYVELVRGGPAKIPIVLDPVMLSSSGRELIDRAGVDLLVGRLLPLVDWVTPNIDELALLSGERVERASDLVTGVRELQAKVGTRLGVIATGGHLVPPDDLLVDSSGEAVWVPGRHIESGATHGTGCKLSSAFLSGLVLGQSAADAGRAAKAYVRVVLEASSRI